MQKPCAVGIGLLLPALCSAQSAFDETWRPTQKGPISRWALSSDGRTIQARFDDTHDHIQEQDGHKVQ